MINVDSAKLIPKAQNDKICWKFGEVMDPLPSGYAYVSDANHEGTNTQHGIMPR